MSVHGCNAVVTGGASGIGLSVCEVLAERGWRVLALDANADAVRRATADHGEAHAVTWAQADIVDVDPTGALIRQFAERHGRIQGLVNAAGVASSTPFLETSAASFRHILEVNAFGTLATSQTVARLMVPYGQGSIVNISSISGLRGNAGRTAYGASKGAVNVMTLVMAVEMAGHGIRVNAIAPGPIVTPMTQVMASGDGTQDIAARVPLGRLGSPRDVASAVAFLLDDRQSAYVTGQILAVDGGIDCAGVVKPSSKESGK